jgi:hypothetical protein
MSQGHHEPKFDKRGVVFHCPSSFFSISYEFAPLSLFTSLFSFQITAAIIAINPGPIHVDLSTKIPENFRHRQKIRPLKIGRKNGRNVLWSG